MSLATEAMPETRLHLCHFPAVFSYIYRICTSCSEGEANVYVDVHNICLTYTPARAWCATTPVNACRRSAKKMHMDTCMRAYSTVQQILCHGGYCELILSLARTSCRLLFTAGPTARPLAGNPLHDVFRSRNPSESTLAHDAVATAVLHKHHPIIRVGAGLIKFVCRSNLCLATEATRNKNAFSPFFARVFSSGRRFLRQPRKARCISRNDGHDSGGACVTHMRSA